MKRLLFNLTSPVRAGGMLAAAVALASVGCSSQPNNREQVNIDAFSQTYRARQAAGQNEVVVDTDVHGKKVTDVVDEPPANTVVDVTDADRAKAQSLMQDGVRSPRTHDNIVHVIESQTVRADTSSFEENNLAGGAAQDTPDADANAADAAAPNAPAPETVAAVGSRVAAIQQETNPDTEYLLDAMVGSVNGQPVYASQIFNNIDPQLKALAARQSVPEFRRQAEQLINARLQQMVTDTLIYGEAERDMSAQELPGLRQVLNEYREKLVREYGEGSLMRAERVLLDEKGQTIDQAVQARREELVVRRYMSRKLSPQIVVTRRDIERFYTENYDRFNPPPERVIRLIVVKSQDDADAVAQRLEAGEAFEQVAQDDRINRYSAAQGGLWGKVEGIEPFGNPDVNAALATLGEHEHSPAIAVNDSFWFVYIEDLIQPPGLSLHDAQLKIDGLLRQQQFQMLSEKERQRLMKHGSYNSLDEMAAALLDIAMSRYVGVAD